MYAEHNEQMSTDSLEASQVPKLGLPLVRGQPCCTAYSEHYNSETLGDLVLHKMRFKNKQTIQNTWKTREQ